MHAEPLREPFDAQAASDFDVNAVLREIAVPRLSGTEGATETGALIRQRFEELGYTVEERDFRFNPFARRFGVTAAGVVYLAGAITATVFLYRGRGYDAVTALLVALTVVALGAYFVRPVLDHMPFTRKRGRNLIATINDAPRYLIVAHRDSKSQPLPLAYRGPGIALAVAAWIAMLCVGLVLGVQPVNGWFVLVPAIVAGISGIILVCCWIANRSPGALDNASGVAAALGIAARERQAGDVAFLITDAEELGLVGARVAAKNLPIVHGAINLDGLDDDGPFHVMERFGIVRKRGLAPHLAVALLQEAEELDQPIERRDLPFGVLVDHIPIAKAGTPALTVMRGTWSSLWRVHRAADNLDNLQGDGVRRAIPLVCGALVRLREQARLLRA